MVMVVVALMVMYLVKDAMVVVVVVMKVIVIVDVAMVLVVVLVILVIVVMIVVIVLILWCIGRLLNKRTWPPKPRPGARLYGRPHCAMAQITEKERLSDIATMSVLEAVVEVTVPFRN